MEDGIKRLMNGKYQADGTGGSENKTATEDIIQKLKDSQALHLGISIDLSRATPMLTGIEREKKE